MDRKLEEQIKILEEENRYLKRLLDEAGIPYEHFEKGEGIKDEAITREHVQFFYSMFKGRNDVYTLRSGKPNAKSGKHAYYTQCENFWDPFLCGKRSQNKVRCSECLNQKYKALTGNDLEAHLKGLKQDCSDVVGLYPVLADETCNFLVFDFDDHDEESDSDKWKTEANALRKICEDNNVPCLVERSRSGKGSHVWLFFDKPVNIKKARQFGVALLDKGAESVDQSSFDTYDRMIPAQDKLPDGGLGNLVALPLQGRAVKAGNSVFVDHNWTPYYDQWQILRNTGKISESFIDDKLTSWKNYRLGKAEESEVKKKSSDEMPWDNSWIENGDFEGEIQIILADKVYIDKTGMNRSLRNKIRRLAAYGNPEYFKKQAMGLSTFSIPRIIYSGDDIGDYIAIPRGCLQTLCEKLDSAGIAYIVEDKRNNGRTINVSFTGLLSEKQKEAAECMLEHDIGILSAATGFGKTVVGTYLIAQRKVNTLILVHTNEIMQGWVDCLQRFLDIDEAFPQYITEKGRIKYRKSLIGRLNGSHNSLTGIIDVVMVASAGNGDTIKPFIRDYGMVIMDECHHGAAESIESTLSQINAHYVYGMTATVKREDKKDKTVLMQFGPVRYSFSAKDNAVIQGIRHLLEPRFTPLVSDKEDLSSNEAYKMLVNSDLRNNIIACDVEECVRHSHTPLVLSKRKVQLDILYDLLKDKADHVLVLTGGRSKAEQKATKEELSSIPENESLIILATGQYIGEGFNCSRLDTLFLATPISWDGNVEQYTGRLNRIHDGKDTVTVIDYVDHNIEFFSKMYNKRLKTYKRIGYELVQEGDDGKDERFFFDKETYYDAFKEDMLHAKKQILISSPYISVTGSERILYFKSLMNEDIHIKIITYPHTRYSKEVSDRIEIVHNKLISAGVDVSFAEHISSKYALFDSEILWYGSMNLVSTIKEDDDEIRIVNKTIAYSLMNN